MLGFSAPGAFAEFLISKERFLWSLDSVAHKIGSAELACELGALIEPVACSYNGMFVAAGGFKPGGHIVVFGCGPIGLGAIALARAAGAGSILAFDISPERNKVAMELGADAAYDPRATPAVDAVLTLTRGWGADMVVEAAGAAIQTMPAIEKIFAPGGKMVYLGRTGLKAPVLLDVLVTQAAMIVGARGHSGGGCFPRILRLIEQNRLQLSPMITRRFPFHQTIDALAASCDRSDAKIMVKF
jgi:threonine dehydrogenase-like Zn-dependent dehydrogenase